MLIGNLTSIYFDGSISGSARAPVSGEISLDLGVKVSVTSATVMKVWDTGPGPWNFASSFTLPYLWNQVTADLQAPTAKLYRQQSDAGIFDLLVTPLTAGYHFSKTEHASIGLGIWVPTSSYDKNRLANVGLNYWSFVPTAAYTGLWPEHGVEFSALGSVQFKPATRIPTTTARRCSRSAPWPPRIWAAAGAPAWWPRGCSSSPTTRARLPTS